jgi:hypothetical protein
MPKGDAIHISLSPFLYYAVVYLKVLPILPIIGVVRAVVFYEKSMDFGKSVKYAMIMEVWRRVNGKWLLVREVVELAKSMTLSKQATTWLYAFQCHQKRNGVYPRLISYRTSTFSAT